LAFELSFLKAKFGLKHISMGVPKPLVSEITHYLNQLNTEQQKAVLGV